MSRADQPKVQGWKNRLAQQGTWKEQIEALLGDPERRALLGTAPDADLAASWKVKKVVVELARKQAELLLSRGPSRGTAPRPGASSRERGALQRGPRKVKIKDLLGDPERRALLGTAPDADLAALWGVKKGMVERARKQAGLFFSRGLPRGEAPRLGASGGERAALRADAEKMAQLGTAPDAHLARLWGLTLGTVAHVRKEQGIPRYRGPRPPALEGHPSEPPRRDFLTGDEERTPLLGTRTDAELAQEWGVSVSSIYAARQRRGIPARGRKADSFQHDPDLIAMLGTTKDVTLAARFGCSRETIRQMREKRGISAFKQEEPVWHADAGAMPDRAVAEKWGVSVNTVAAYRSDKGIPRVPPPRGRPNEKARAKESLSKACYERAAAGAAEGRPLEWAAVADAAGAASGARACTLARAYAKIRGLPWPLSPNPSGFPADLCERAYRLWAAPPARSWQEIAAALGLEDTRRAGERLRQTVEHHAQRQGWAWPPRRER